MSGFSQTLRNFRNIWNHGDDEYLDDDEFERDEDERNSQRQSAPQNAPTSSTQSRSAEPTKPQSDRAPFPQNGGGGGSVVDNVKRLRPVSPALRAREKNIYALRPRSQEEAVAAADALKTGDAVVINLEELPRPEAIRIIDFMSGVCYGLEHQGHAMKLGELIFLYTPGDFEISSDESDYGENTEPFFMDEGDKLSALSRVAINNPRVIPVVAPAPESSATNPQVASQMAQMQAQAAQAQAAQAQAAQAASELTAASAQVVPDPQLQAQRAAIRAAQSSQMQSLPRQPLTDQSLIDNAFASTSSTRSSENTPSSRAIPAPIGGHLTAQGYISPTAPVPRKTDDESVEPLRVRRPWER